MVLQWLVQRRAAFHFYNQLGNELYGTVLSTGFTLRIELKPASGRSVQQRSSDTINSSLKG